MRLSDRAIASLVARGDIFVWDGTAYCPITMDDGDRQLFVQLHDGSYSNYPPIYDGRNHPAPGLERPMSARDEIDETVRDAIRETKDIVYSVNQGIGCFLHVIGKIVIAYIIAWIVVVVWGLITTGTTHF
jgi:hypothetical protein